MSRPEIILHKKSKNGTSAGIVRNLKRQSNNLHCAELKHFTFKSRNYAYTFPLAEIV